MAKNPRNWFSEFFSGTLPRGASLVLQSATGTPQIISAAGSNVINISNLSGGQSLQALSGFALVGSGSASITLQNGATISGGGTWQINAPFQFNSVFTLPAFTVAGLPAGSNGQLAYATNGRKVGEGVGAGTGVVVYFSNGSWRVFSTDAAVAA